MNELTIYKDIPDELALSKLSDFDSKVQALLDCLVSPYSDGTIGNSSAERDESIITELYFLILKRGQGAPTITELTQDIMDYNYDIFYEIAQLDYYENYYGGNGKPTSKFNVKYQSDEMIARLQNKWWDELFLEASFGVAGYIEQFLDQKQMVYEAHESDMLYEEHHLYYSQIIIYKNDCQNILVPQFHEDSLSYMGDEITQEEKNIIQIKSRGD